MEDIFKKVFDRRKTNDPSNVIEEENPYSDDEFEYEDEKQEIIDLKQKIKNLIGVLGPKNVFLMNLKEQLMNNVNDLKILEKQLLDNIKSINELKDYRPVKKGGGSHKKIITKRKRRKEKDEKKKTKRKRRFTKSLY